MMKDSTLVLITGASGFVGSHIAKHSLDTGYAIRLTARPPKLQQLRAFYDGNANVDVVPIEDIATSDFTSALKGVGAVIHVASPLPISNTSKDMMNGAINGTMNIARQAAEAGVKRFVFTSSSTACTVWGTDYYNERVITDEDWNDATKNEVLSGSRDDDVSWTYSAVKSIAEQELWDFAATHPDMDVTSINPPMVYGPVLQGIRLTSQELDKYSSVSCFYRGIFPPSTQNGDSKPKLEEYVLPLSVDVRDVAKAHVLALTAPLAMKLGVRKRILLAGPTMLYIDAVEYLYATRPELRERLPDTSEARKRSVCVMDVTKARDILGFTDFIDWRKTVDDTVDSILEIQRGWEN